MLSVNMLERDIPVRNVIMWHLRQKKIKVHSKIKHEGVRYSCSKCNFFASSAGNLTEHIQRVHNGFMYLFEKMRFYVGFKKCLRVHIENKHDNVRYPCSKCDYF